MDVQTKKEIRKFILEKRRGFDFDTRKKWDKDIFTQLVNSETYKNATAIFAFVSFNDEVDTHQIISHAIKNHKTICVPKINLKSKEMEIFKINGLEDLKRGYYDILEPIEGCPAMDSKDIDLILMPGVAFDRQGGRVGYGAGFYDRFLKEMNRTVDKIALAYHFQVLEAVPMDQFDVRIDGIITNEEFMHIDLCP